GDGALERRDQAGGAVARALTRPRAHIALTAIREGDPAVQDPGAGGPERERLVGQRHEAEAPAEGYAHEHEDDASRAPHDHRDNTYRQGVPLDAARLGRIRGLRPWPMTATNRWISSRPTSIAAGISSPVATTR